MKSSEASLWRWLSKSAPEGCVLERVENSVKPGTPDIFGTWKNSFVLELKNVEMSKSGIVHSELTAEQASFLRRWRAAGGRGYVLIRVNRSHYLVSAIMCHLLLKPISIFELTKISMIKSAATAQEILRRCSQ